MISKENKQKLICLSGLCEHSSSDSSCYFLKYVDKGPEYLLSIFEKIVSDEVKSRLKKEDKKNGKTKKSVRK